MRILSFVYAYGSFLSTYLSSKSFSPASYFSDNTRCGGSIPHVRKRLEEERKTGLSVHLKRLLLLRKMSSANSGATRSSVLPRFDTQRRMTIWNALLLKGGPMLSASFSSRHDRVHELLRSTL